MNTFALVTAADLREKLRRDLERMRRDPADSDAAFDFFVTGWHMTDWVIPEGAGLKKHSLIKICSHIANGAKHFGTDKRHDAVKSTGLREAFGVNPFGAGGFGTPCLVVELEEKDRRALDDLLPAEAGEVIGALHLGILIMKFWDEKLKV
jgi:hypothetical protein